MTPTRCPSCGHLPASRVTVCVVCKTDYAAAQGSLPARMGSVAEADRSDLVVDSRNPSTFSATSASAYPASAAPLPAEACTDEADYSMVRFNTWRI